MFVQLNICICIKDIHSWSQETPWMVMKYFPMLLNYANILV